MGYLRIGDEPGRAGERVLALAGNPNVGKSTLFNRLTGLRQHTGNWPGKTVEAAWGRFEAAGERFVLADTPGAYSLCARSGEEEAARDAILYGGAEMVIAVCDATCLERSLNLALQIIETGRRTMVCVNLLDEAKRKGVKVDLQGLEAMLGVPVAGVSAASGGGLADFRRAVCRALAAPEGEVVPPYAPETRALLRPLAEAAGGGDGLSPMWVAARLAEGDEALLTGLSAYLGFDPAARPGAAAALSALRAAIPDAPGRLKGELFGRAREIAEACVSGDWGPAPRQARLDRFFTGRATALPAMLLLLGAVFAITIAGANVPSEWLWRGFSALQARLRALLAAAGASEFACRLVAEGAFGVMGRVVSVMLPPMAIFFPLFTLLEDLGYLPRVAFVMDRSFQRCRACGKQCLTMMMGLGCNAAGVMGCRIIDSPRERLIAILTNALVPCNGRFPLMIAVLGAFFAAGGAILPAAMLTGVIVLGVAATLAASRLLTATLLRGAPSAFTLELPPFRAPRVGQVLIRSVLDRTLRVLIRAVLVAAPAGILIFLAANWSPGGVTLLARLTGALDPVGRALGLDGVILTAFVLALPANELVLPIALMAYLAQGTLAEAQNLETLAETLRANGWTGLTALNTVLFSLMHWPCATTLLTIRKEAGGWRWALAALMLPTLMGAAACALTAFVYRLMGGG